MFRLTTCLFLSSFLMVSALEAQAQPQRDPQALALAKLSVQALAGNTALTDATLQGTANFVAGSDEESGTFTLEVKGNREGKLVVNLSGGARQEIRQQQTGEWVGTDGQKHAMALHNCWVDASWLLPVFTLEAALGNQQMAAIYLGQTTRGGVAVDHLQFSYVITGQAQKVTAGIQTLSAMDLYLDATSHLPVVLDFNVHPDNDLNLNIPVEVQFSGYQQTNGINVRTRIQKLIQGTLTLDMTISGVAVNTGIPDSEFNTQ